MVTAPVVEKPSTAEELARRLHQAAESGSAVVPVGGGKASGMGGAPLRCDVELHTTGLDRVLEHSQADMVVSRLDGRDRCASALAPRATSSSASVWLFPMGISPRQAGAWSRT